MTTQARVIRARKLTLVSPYRQAVCCVIARYAVFSPVAKASLFEGAAAKSAAHQHLVALISIVAARSTRSIGNDNLQS